MLRIFKQKFPVFFSKLFSRTSKNLAGYMSLTYSITGLLIFAGLAGRHALAADIAIIQGAVLATFYVLSGDARHLILSGKIQAEQVIFFRLICLLPLAGLSYSMSSIAGNIDGAILLGFILRRCTEWLAEAHVTEIERINGLWSGWLLQPLMFLLVAFQLLTSNDLWMIWIWAVSPIFFSFKFILRAKPYSFTNLKWENITSTAVIGFTGYIQRILIISLMGKELSGMLFPGFAIGSFVGSMASNVVGPTLDSKGLFHSRHFNAGIFIFCIFGLLAFFLSNSNLYKTIGLSVIGGGVMILAQQSRLFILKNKHALDLDLLFQLTLILSIPAIYYASDGKAMSGFYLIGSVIAWIFYKGNHYFMKASYDLKKNLFIFTSVGMLFPIFFQLNGNIYNNELIAMVDSGGNFKNVPLPLSLLICYLGIFLFRANLDRAKSIVLTISAMFLLLITSAIITNHGLQKLILLVQFIAPTVALFLGFSLIDINRKLFAKVALYFLLIFVPIQLIMTWIQGQLALTHYMYLFSVYSHYQYVPLVIVGLYAWSWVELRDSHAKWILLLAPWMALYVSAANSMLALIGLSIFSWAFVIYTKKRKWDFIIPLITILMIASYFQLNSNLGPDIYKKTRETWVCKSGKFSDDLNGPCKAGVFEGKIFDAKGGWLQHDQSNSENLNTPPTNIRERKAFAEVYIADILKQPISILYGHSNPPARNVASSAHNYYLDLLYNFGIISCLPIMLLIIYTIKQTYHYKKEDSSIIWLMFIVLYFVIIDNNLKVTLRQPYPAMVVYLLWGSLLGIIQTIKNKKV